jgi:hypothetical protein
MGYFTGRALTFLAAETCSPAAPRYMLLGVMPVKRRLGLSPRVVANFAVFVEAARPCIVGRLQDAAA